MVAHISGVDFANNLYNQALALGAELKLEKVTGVEDLGKVKRVRSTLAEYEAGAVILATGSENRKLGLDWEQELTGRGVSYCATCDGNFFRNKDVAVVGGGNTALLGEKRLSGLEITDKLSGEKRTIEVKGLFVAVGRIPENEGFSALIDLDPAGYVVAGENCRTKVPGVFVAGDNRTKELRQLVTAAADGAVAATEAVKYLNG